MPRANKELEFERKRIRSFGGGLNTETFNTDIQDDELEVCQNMFIDDFGFLRTRIGTARTSNSVMDSDINALGYLRAITAGTTPTDIKENLFMRESDKNWYGFTSAFASYTRIDDGTAPLNDSAAALWSFVSVLAVDSGATPTLFPVVAAFPWINAEAAAGTYYAFIWGGLSRNLYTNGAGKAHPINTTIISAANEVLRPKYATIFGKRVFMISADNPDTIGYSDLGAFVGVVSSNKRQWFPLGRPMNNTEPITGMIGFNKRLFIFTKSKIMMMVPDANAPEDTSKWFFYTVSDKIGTRFPFSVKNVGNDVIFLSDYGLASLRAVQEFGDFQTAILSNKISDLRGVDDATYPNVHAEIDPIMGHYILAITDSDKIVKCFVFDYKQYQISQKVRWFEYTGKYLGCRLSNMLVADTVRLAITGKHQGGSVATSIYYPYKPTELSTQADFFKDQDDSGTAQAFSQTWTSKSFTHDTESYHKRINKFGIHAVFLKDTAGTETLNLKYGVNQSPDLANFQITLPQVSAPFQLNLVRRAVDTSVTSIPPPGPPSYFTSIPKVYRNIKFIYQNNNGVGLSFKELWWDWQFAGDILASTTLWQAPAIYPNGNTNPETGITTLSSEIAWTSVTNSTGTASFSGAGSLIPNAYVFSFGFPSSSFTFTQLGLQFTFSHTPAGTYGTNWSLGNSPYTLKMNYFVSTDDGVTYPTTVDYVSGFDTLPEFSIPFVKPSNVTVYRDITYLTTNPDNVRVAFFPNTDLTTGAFNATWNVTGVKLIGTYVI